MSTSRRGAIHIALTFDDKFWAPAYAVMRSICLTTHRKSDLHFHLMHLALSSEHQAELQTIGRDYGATLTFYDLRQTQLLTGRIAGLPRVMRGRLHDVVYARLFLHELLPPGTARALYLDCDTFVRSPIEQLFEIDMQGMTLAAVKQVNSMRQLGGRDLREKTLFSMAEPYFNAGVVLVDLEKYAEVDVVEAVRFSLPPEIIEQLLFDQDILNYVFRGRILELDFRWNLQNAEPAHEALDPHIAHYSGDLKPWALKPRLAYSGTYRHTMTNELFYRYYRFRMKHKLLKLLGATRRKPA